MSSLLYRQIYKYEGDHPLCLTTAHPRERAYFIQEITRLVPSEPIEPLGYRLSPMTVGYGTYIWDLLVANPLHQHPHFATWCTARKIVGTWYVFHAIRGEVGEIRFRPLVHVDLNQQGGIPHRDIALYWRSIERRPPELPVWREGFSKRHDYLLHNPQG